MLKTSLAAIQDNKNTGYKWLVEHHIIMSRWQKFDDVFFMLASAQSSSNRSTTVSSNEFQFTLVRLGLFELKFNGFLNDPAIKSKSVIRLSPLWKNKCLFTSILLSVHFGFWSTFHVCMFAVKHLNEVQYHKDANVCKIRSLTNKWNEMKMKN